MLKSEFKSSFGEGIFRSKYALTQSESWHQRAITIVDSVCGTVGGTKRPLLSESERDYLVYLISTFKFMPGGRYIYYSGRAASFYNNCYLLKGEEDTREEWARLAQSTTSCLMTGGGIGTDYSVFREEGRLLSRTGGTSSGPIPLMKIANEIGRNVMQGGSRRSALYASLVHSHPDIMKFIQSKDWHHQQLPGTDKTLWDAKFEDFNFPAPLDMTNISVNYDTDVGHVKRCREVEVFKLRIPQCLVSTG